MYIIPAIDILNGKVVRLREGDYDQVTSYDVTLEEMIDKYQSNGTEIIHIIDLNGAKGDFSNQKFLFDMIKKTDIKVQYGGGVRSIKKVKELIAEENMELFVQNFKDIEEFACLFVVDGQFTNFVFIPFPEDQTEERD